MTVTLVAQYRRPENIEQFDAHYFGTHVPLAEKMPGLIRAEYKRVVATPMGNEPDLYLIAELSFANRQELDNALSSAEGKAAAKDLMGFAGSLVKLYISETVNQPATV